MDFNYLLELADKQQNDSAVDKKKTAYFNSKISPAKKEPRSKVQSDAISAFLKRKEHEEKKKEYEFLRKKSELLAARQAANKGRTAHSMASRTKDNLKNKVDLRINKRDVQNYEEEMRKFQEKVERIKNERLECIESEITGHPVKSKKSNKSKETPRKSYDVSRHIGKNVHVPALEKLPSKKVRKEEVDRILSKNKTKMLNDHMISEESDNEDDNSDKPAKVEKKPKPKRRPPPPPSAMDFKQLLKLAEQKQHEPIPEPPVVQKKASPERRLLTKKEQEEMKLVEQARRRRREEEQSRKRGADTKPSSGLSKKMKTDINMRQHGKLKVDRYSERQTRHEISDSASESEGGECHSSKDVLRTNRDKERLSRESHTGRMSNKSGDSAKFNHISRQESDRSHSLSSSKNSAKENKPADSSRREHEKQAKDRYEKKEIFKHSVSSSNSTDRKGEGQATTDRKSTKSEHGKDNNISSTVFLTASKHRKSSVSTSSKLHNHISKHSSHDKPKDSTSSSNTNTSKRSSGDKRKQSLSNATSSSSKYSSSDKHKQFTSGTGNSSSKLSSGGRIKNVASSANGSSSKYHPDNKSKECISSTGNDASEQSSGSKLKAFSNSQLRLISAHKQSHGKSSNKLEQKKPVVSSKSDVSRNDKQVSSNVCSLKTKSSDGTKHAGFSNHRGEKKSHKRDNSVDRDYGVQSGKVQELENKAVDINEMLEAKKREIAELEALLAKRSASEHSSRKMAPNNRSTKHKYKDIDILEVNDSQEKIHPKKEGTSQRKQLEYHPSPIKRTGSDVGLSDSKRPKMSNVQSRLKHSNSPRLKEQNAKIVDNSIPQKPNLVDGKPRKLPPIGKVYKRGVPKDLPPIGAYYKRGAFRNPYLEETEDEEEEEWDSDMDDFICDEEGEVNEQDVSKYITEIFGYDRNRYRYESDDDDYNMESSFTQQMKEEARSTRLGKLEDLTDMKLEEEAKKIKMTRKKRR